MKPRNAISRRRQGHSLARVLTAIAVFGLSLAASAQTFSVLHNFTGGSDGYTPYAGVTIDNAGNLYGTTSEYSGVGGTVFEMKRRNGAWIFNTLASYVYWQPGPTIPQGRVVIGPGGSLYATSFCGGNSFCTERGCGTVFALRASQTFCRSVSCPWTTSLAYQFQGPDGDEPGFVDPVFDSAGDIYGTTTVGGQFGNGNVFQLTRTNGQYTGTSLHDFKSDGSEGIYPQSTVTLDAQGNIYGTAYYSGPNDHGTAWRLTHSGSGWSFDVLYSFPNNADGNGPVGGLMFDQAGNLYGTTFSGGVNGGGTVFELSPSGGGWNFSVIYSFTGQGFNPGPFDTLTRDAAGNLYGTTYGGGAHACGSVFKLARNGGNWSYSSLYDFGCGSAGANPIGGVAIDAAGNLYGTASTGGHPGCGGEGCGVIWEITP